MNRLRTAVFVFPSKMIWVNALWFDSVHITLTSINATIIYILWTTCLFRGKKYICLNITNSVRSRWHCPRLQVFFCRGEGCRLNNNGVLCVADVTTVTRVVGRVQEKRRRGECHQIPTGKVTFPGVSETQDDVSKACINKEQEIHSLRPPDIPHYH